MKNALFIDRHVLPILGVIVACTLPHFFNISMWSVIACLFVWIYTVTTSRYSLRLPGRVAKLFMVAIFFLLAMTTNEGFTIEAFVALLALMICMKLLDIRGRRDRITTVILCYFLIVGSLFFDDSIFATTYMIFTVLLTTVVLMYVNQPGRSSRDYVRLSAVIMGQALPIMLLMFLLFPRIQGGVWGRAPIHSAQTGFSDTMGFGDIANMAQNTDVAFRVEFEDEIPPLDQLYWRGVVLWKFDGHTWFRGVSRRGSSPKRSLASREVNYTLTLEPHNERWLITLDLPMRISLRRSWLLDDFSYYRWRQITQRVAYTGTSFLDANDQVQSNFEDTEGIELPPELNPRARAMAEKWFGESANVQDYINRVLGHFSAQSFVYTLQPPPLSPGTENPDNSSAGNLVDSFLFETRKGFCEHYATAFAFLMRAAGVPARVVVGYLGGAQNAFGGYLVVRQSQAHAWCEVWIEEKGWVRIDPTAAVAPTRLIGDVSDAVPDDELVDLMSYFRGTPLEPWMEPVVGMLDLVNSRWNKWVMGYSIFEQVDLFARFGIDIEDSEGPVKAFVTAMVVLGAVALVVSFLILRKPRSAKDIPSLAWMELCTKLARIDLGRSAGQGPVDYLAFVVSRRPDMEKQVSEIVNLYIRLRYEKHATDEDAAMLQNLVKQFRPNRLRA